MKMYQKVEPPREKPKDDKGYFEILSKAVFNAGFSYQVVRNKWEGIKELILKCSQNGRLMR
jgi:3-methyladenine DNA glycosylase Tag